MSEANPVLAALGRPIRLGILGGAPPSMIVTKSNKLKGDASCIPFFIFRII